MMMTMFLPAYSGRRPTSIAAATAAPDEMPTGMPFQTRDQPRRVEGGLIADRDHFVDHAAIENGRRETGADALDLVRPRLAAGQNRRIFRLDRDHLEARPARLQHLADAGDRAAGADARNDDVDLAMRVVPDFLGGGAAMDVRIGGVLELLGNDRAGRRGDDLLAPWRSRPSCPAAPASARVRRRAAPASCAARSTSIPA